MGVIKIAVINYSYGIGSTGKLVQQIEENADREKYQFEFFCKKSNKVASNIHIVGNKVGYLVEGFHSRLMGKQGYGMYRSTKKIIQYLNNWKPDIVHLHTVHGNYINFPLIMRYCSKQKIPVLWNLHDCWAFTGNCGYYTEIQCNKWLKKKECNKCPDVHNYPPSFFWDRAHEMYQDKKKLYEMQSKLQFIAVSNWLADEAKKSDLLCRYPITCIYNWVDTNKFIPYNDKFVQKLRTDSKEKYLVVSVASDWSLAKGLGRIIKLANAYPDKVRVFLIGKCRKKHLPNNITVVGKILSQEGLAKYYSAADVLLNLSIEETFGLTTAEALACGTPAIVLNTTACPEVVGDCGIVIDQFSPEAVMTALEEVADNPSQFAQKRCRERVRNLFSKNNIQQYFAMYDKINGEM